MTVTSKGFADRLTARPVTHSRITGIGGYRPRRVVPNSELVERIDSSDEWIRERSGILERRFAGEGESVIDMSAFASTPALEMAGVAPEDIDVVLLATVSWPYQTPAAAPMLAERLGTKGAAFDISAACAGYCHGIAVASDLVRTGTARHVLVVGVERLSDFTSLDDRGTAFIFADGAGAAVVSQSDTVGIAPTVWGSDGANWEAISQTESWIDVHQKGLDWPHIGMAGQTVFRWAVWGMAPVAQQALDVAGITADQLDAFIPHQANVRIIDAMAKKLNMPADIPIARDIAYTGNTSAASIPLAMERMVRQGEIPSGGLALQIGFGAGLSFAAQVVVIP
ncbi:beta-ketoacyl-ACP synthase III [Nostocoides sp. Soil756]|jgi:3-oxoacyl-[acyl-carrier-protein] synthase-3|uniref:beta-ketoacyl-ACP synthase III n=1 Tax=Nostocoides sp. Soil756 TaxID=1736399 RepID=UPI0006FD8BEE|nr:beta-ketoacyl-ACP synthase III [Tetrasphaera sp. Soil756]KRE62580.1 3-oxoacyl-ACP synthase [Tetrasphaera sp. Soil756]